MILFDPVTITTALTQSVEALRATVNAPATVVTIDRGPLAVSVATGASDLESAKAARADQTYEIGSQTKLMTAVAILQLVEDGKIDLDAPASRYLPAGTVAGIANADIVTVRQLLNMTAGIENYSELRDADGVPLFINALLSDPDRIFGPKQALDLVRGVPPVGAPGEAFFYSNTNYALLGQMIEAQSGATFYEALRDGIFVPTGMNDTVRQLGTHDPRLSSYLENPATGALIDVTRAQWEMRGEAGIASTTTDMVRFLQALFVDKTLLGAATLTEMMDYVPTGATDEVDTGFGLGLVKFTFIDGDTYLGFTGGTLGTASSTYLNSNTGEVIALGATDESLDTLEGGFVVLQQSRETTGFDLVDDCGPVRVLSGTAAELILRPAGGGLEHRLAGAVLTLDRRLVDVTTDSLSFADGSIVVVGDNRAGNGDGAGNDIDILRDFAGARQSDNQLIGLGGDDVLKAGLGDDRVVGGSGADTIWGRDGNDRLIGQAGRDFIYGGSGADVLVGGQGPDVMWGGNGADRFVFAGSANRLPTEQDVIRDFAAGQDIIDLRGATAGKLAWIGEAGFSGGVEAVQVRNQGTRTLVQADIDGDGSADLRVLLTGVQGVTATDFLL